YDLAELVMGNACDGANDDRLVHGARNHFAGPCLARASAWTLNDFPCVILIDGVWHNFISFSPWWFDEPESFQYGPRLVGGDAIGSAVPIGRSAAEAEDGGAPVAGLFSSSITHPKSFLLVL